MDRRCCKLILLISLLLIPSLCFAMPLWQVGGYSKTLLWQETFEAISDTEEWSNDGNWTEVPASTNLIIGDSTRYKNGVLSGELVGGSAGRRVYRTFTSTGYMSGSFWYQYDTVPATTPSQVLMITVGDTELTANRIIFLVLTSANLLQQLDNASYTTIKTLAADTWYLMEWQINTNQADGIDAVRIWIDNVEGTNSPYDASYRNNPSGIDRLATSNWADAISQWYDDITVYQGTR